MTSIHFPPYGHMIQEWEIDTDPLKAPDDWPDKARYPEWLERMASLLGEVLWPRFEQGGWIGKAAASMDALTDLDFTLLAPFRERIKEPTSDLPPLNMMQLFQLEDQQDADTLGADPRIDRGPDRSLHLMQEPILGQELAKQFVEIYMAGKNSRTGNVDLDLKNRMQRPRAYQMSWVMGKDGFSHQRACSAISPSLVSGHALVTMMGAVSVRRWAVDKGLDERAFPILRKFTLGVGDRRVYAGVHYPSDNLSSWLTGLLLCPEVGVLEEDIVWLWEAIPAESDIYQAIDDADRHSGGRSPYHLALSLLKEIGGRGVKTIGDAERWLEDVLEDA